MKKVIIVCEILILFVFLAKIAMIGGIIKNPETADGILSVNKAVADSTVAATSTPPVRDVTEDSLAGERKLSASLLEKQKELEKRGNILESEEKRLNSLRDEILSKIDSLGEMEGRLTGLLEMIKEMNSQKYKDLAKIYEAAPPAQAGFMLEKLDRKTAAAIIMNMKSKKAGAILGQMAPAKSVDVTKEITRLR